ncbi:hypothetical protein V3C99_018555 [Haemonchus contortus]
MRMKSTAWTSKQKAFFLIGHLDGIAREKIEELSNEEREDYSNVVAHLKQSFGGPQYRYMARQSLASCQQQVGESAAIFANRLLLLVRAAMAGHDPASQKERVLEEFVARLRPDIRYYVKLDNPATFEKAVAKAQMVEQLLAEATADRLIRPSQPAQPIEVKAAIAPRRDNRGPRHNKRLPPRARASYQSFQGIRNTGPQQPGILAPTCFNCGGSGHYSRVCPTPRANRRQSDTGSFSSRPQRRSRTSNFSSSRKTDHELRQAREQIRALSLSLHENQSALENSDARVNALIKRNEELANSAFGSGSPVLCCGLNEHPSDAYSLILQLVQSRLGDPTSGTLFLQELYRSPRGGYSTHLVPICFSGTPHGTCS